MVASAPSLITFTGWRRKPSRVRTNTCAASPMRTTAAVGTLHWPPAVAAASVASTDWPGSRRCAPRVVTARTVTVWFAGVDAAADRR